MDQTRTRRLQSSIPTSYTVYKDGSNYRAESCISGGTDYGPDTDATTVIQAANDYLNEDGLIHLKKATYTFTETVQLDQGISLIISEGAIIDKSNVGFCFDFKSSALDPQKFTALYGGKFTLHNIADAVRFVDIERATMKDSAIYQPNTGIEITSDKYWSEGSYLSNIRIYSPNDAGIKYSAVQDLGGGGGGTNSRMDAKLEQIRIDMQNPSGKKGVSIETDVDFRSSGIDGLFGWNNNGTLLYMDGTVSDLVVNRLRMEAKGGTPYPVTFDSNAVVSYNRCPVFLNSTLDIGGGILNTADVPVLEVRHGKITIHGTPTTRPRLQANKGQYAGWEVMGNADMTSGDFVFGVRDDATNDKRLFGVQKGGIAVLQNANAQRVKMENAAGDERAGMGVGSSGNRGWIKLYDATLGTFRYIYIDNGSLVIAANEPT